jgi:two-component system, sensor histidine kinase YesM
MKRIFIEFRKFLLNLKLKGKLLILSLLLIVLPFAVFTLITYERVSYKVKSQTITSAKLMLDNVTSVLNFKTKNVLNSLDIISYDTNVNDILSRAQSDYPVPDQLKDANQLTSLFTNLQNSTGVYRIRMYLRPGLIYSDENQNIFDIDTIQNTTWYKNMMTGNGTTQWYTSAYMSNSDSGNLKFISAIKVIWNIEVFSDKLGVLRIDILQSDLLNIIKKAKVTDNTNVYIRNSKNEIVACSNDTAANKWSKVLMNYSDQSWNTKTINGQNIIVSTNPISNSDWTLVTVIPMNDILSISKNLKNEMLFLMLVIAAITYFIISYISLLYTKKINQIIRKMKKVQTGDLDVIVSTQSKDEIGELIENFNYMMNKIKVLNEEQFRAGISIKSAELKALQAQINPHFLYNTLDIINCLAIENKIPDISRMIQSLSKFYKLSLSNGRDIVTIRDELEHVELYVQIQNRRYSNRINLLLDVDKEILDCKIPKLLLQPLVENAIIHGLFEKESKSGYINILGKHDKDTIILKVVDNGMGISEDRIKQIFQFDNSEQIHGYGVKNINERIKLYYGNDYGLFYQSVQGKGSTVEIRIPKV